MNPTYIKEQFIQNLLIWYERNKRELAFRKDKNPYRIWISEIMAQQTRIETMIPYFERFIQKYPDVKSLSQADDDELMAMWQGLGYYSRARSLKKAAIMIMEEYDGVFPLKKKNSKSCRESGIIPLERLLPLPAGKKPQPLMEMSFESFLDYLNLAKILARLQEKTDDRSG